MKKALSCKEASKAVPAISMLKLIIEIYSIKPIRVHQLANLTYLEEIRKLENIKTWIQIP